MRAKDMEEYSAWVEYKENNNQEVFQGLVLRYLPLVKYHAGRVKMMVPIFIEEEDLVSYGILGLIDAIHKFEYNKGVLFKTYASRRIRGEIIDRLRKLDWLPHSVRREGKLIKEISDKLKTKLGRRPTVEEIASLSEISQERIKQLSQQLHFSEWVSLYDDFGDIKILDMISSENSQDPEQIYDESVKIDLLASVIDRLSDDEKTVISLVYYEELTQKEIAKVMDLSAARISQIHKKAVNRLRGMLVNNRQQLF